jgi:hypothetical protein
LIFHKYSLEIIQQDLTNSNALSVFLCLTVSFEAVFGGLTGDLHEKVYIHCRPASLRAKIAVIVAIIVCAALNNYPYSMQGRAQLTAG